ncbi:MAG: DNA recombination protein RmuC [Bacillales bacterium]|nr:DNA recombination protein RmuC [Bacillales bacterium]
MTTGEKIIIILLAVAIALIILAVILLLKKKNTTTSFDFAEKIKSANDDQEKRLMDDNNRLRNDVYQIKVDTNKELSLFKDNMNTSIDERFKEVNKTLNEGILKISETMNKNVTDNFEKTNQTFSDIKERMARIDEAQKNLKNVETSITSFKEVLENKKARGNFGEFQLNTILSDVFGPEGNIYKIQSTMSNGYIADSLLNLPDPLGKIVIDSKFPFDNFKKIYNPEISDLEKNEARKLFKNDVKKHLSDISSKYIIKGETSEQAIMFVPSEAVFAEINANFPDLIQESQKLKVWITSPTTLISILQTVEIMLKEAERSKNAKKLFDELAKLSEDFDRYEKRWSQFENRLSSVVTSAQDIRKSSDKISKKFQKINNNSSSIGLEEDEDEEEKKEEETI